MTPQRNGLSARAATGMLLSAAGLAFCAAGAGCAPHPSSALAPVRTQERVPSNIAPRNGPNHVAHVVVIIQENRSFDNMFYGYPGADTATQGLNSLGQVIQLQPVSLTATYDVEHQSTDMFAACDGAPAGQNCKMDAFDKEVVSGSAPANPEYAYVPPNESALYFAIAHQYVLADRMFTSHIDASFVSHQYIIAGQSNHAVDLPSTAWGCDGGRSDTVATLNLDRTFGTPESPCFHYKTIADELDNHGLSWRFYAPASGQSGYEWSGFQAVKHIKDGSEWTTNVLNPPGQFITDVGNGQLASVTWITPTFVDSDHGSKATGPAWVASVVNAVGQSQFWNTTTIFIMWDEWGGWYDHVPPPYLDYDGLGFRVPLIVVSPYAKAGYVSHVQYEHGSILKYIEDTFRLPRLAASDTRANSPATDAFDYTHAPRPFQTFQTNVDPAVFVHEPPSTRLPDDE